MLHAAMHSVAQAADAFARSCLKSAHAQSTTERAFEDTCTERCSAGREAESICVLAAPKLLTDAGASASAYMTTAVFIRG